MSHKQSQTQWKKYSRCKTKNKKILLFPEMQLTKKIFTRVATNLFIFNQSNYIFKENLHLKNYAYTNNTFVC